MRDSVPVLVVVRDGIQLGLWKFTEIREYGVEDGMFVFESGRRAAGGEVSDCEMRWCTSSRSHIHSRTYAHSRARLYTSPATDALYGNVPSLYMIWLSSHRVCTP